VTLIDAPRNLGFAGGVNVGIGAAIGLSSEFVLLVNSDAVLAPDAIAHLLETAAACPQAGVLGPLIVSREEPDWIVSAGIDYSAMTGRMQNRLTSRPVREAPSGPVAVAAVTGCVMLIRRTVFEAAGLFDDAYFFSFEDLDFCMRVREAGFSVLCVPQARAWHEGSRSIGRRSPRRIYFATRNHLRLAGSLEPRPIHRAVRAAFIIGLNTAYELTTPDAPLWSGVAALIRGSWHHLLGRYGPDPAA
jgi:GT2 family glycosyltransferase